MTLASATGAIPLTPLNLATAAALILVAGAISLGLRLGLERRLAVASVRTVVQLVLVGYVLRWVFDLESLWLVLALALLMVAAASLAAIRRPSRTFSGATWRAFLTLTASGLLTTVVVTTFIVHAQPWYRPQYFIPLLGMVLGNSLTGLSLGLDALLDRVVERRDEIDMQLALGATRYEAARDALADAIRRGMIPIINAMMVVGIVSLPGMMTGQILQGAPPMQAIQYQIMVMFMVAAGTALGCMLIVLLAYRRLFTASHRLDLSSVRKQAHA